MVDASGNARICNRRSARPSRTAQRAIRRPSKSATLARIPAFSERSIHSESPCHGIPGEKPQPDGILNTSPTAAFFSPFLRSNTQRKLADDIDSAGLRPRVVAIASAQLPFASYLRSCPPDLSEKGLLSMFYDKWPRSALLQEVASKVVVAKCVEAADSAALVATPQVGLRRLRTIMLGNKPGAGAMAYYLLLNT